MLRVPQVQGLVTWRGERRGHRGLRTGLSPCPPVTSQNPEKKTLVPVPPQVCPSQTRCLSSWGRGGTWWEVGAPGQRAVPPTMFASLPRVLLPFLSCLCRACPDASLLPCVPFLSTLGPSFPLVRRAGDPGPGARLCSPPCPLAPSRQAVCLNFVRYSCFLSPQFPS